MLAVEEKTSEVVPVASYATEFRSYKDDAWYTVCILFHGDTLTVKYSNFSSENDDAFRPSHFRDWRELEGFKGRFRPLSKQLQDDECRLLSPGARVCACQSFAHDDVRFYDALVDGDAQRSKQCTINVCSHKVSKEDSDFEMVPYCNKRSNTTRTITYFGRMIKETQRARRSVVNACSPEVSCHDRRMEDRDLEGSKNLCVILITNIDKELCPSTVTEFLRRHTSLSVRVFIFPSLSMEVYTRGAIMVHSEKEFQELCGFLNNPNCIITSSTGRPWVILEKVVGLKNIKASIGAMVHISENILQEKKRGAGNNLKVVHSGTKEFKRASIMRDLFWAFCEHQERLQKRLALEERRIFAANPQLP